MKKNILLLIPLVLLVGTIFAQTCYPDQNGQYLYYLTLKIDTVEGDFQKANLIRWLAGSSFANTSTVKVLESNLDKVKKAFPDAQTPALQKTVAAYAKDSTLARVLSTFTDKVAMVERVCLPKEKLLFEPNDYYFYGGKMTHLDLINADEAYDITTGDERILIGITDTYLEVTHDDIKNKIQQILQNAVNPSAHGTQVTGTAAAETDNNLGIASSGNKSKVVFSSNWASTSQVLSMAQIPGVRVINMSWINHCTSSSTQEMVFDEILNLHNTVVVAGAGNNCGHCGCNAYAYPAAYSSVISVTSVGHINDYGHVDPTYGATNWKDCHEDLIGDPNFSHHHNDRVDIAAPGYNVLVTDNNNWYGGGWGTSFGAPMVAGVCALVAAVNPCLTAQEIKDIVIHTSDPNIYMLDCNQDYFGLLGNGRVDAYEAVKRAVEVGTLYVQDKTYSSGTATESANTDLICGYNVTSQLPYGLITVQQSADVVFEATKTIVLGEGFRVLDNAQFEAKIIDSPCF